MRVKTWFLGVLLTLVPSVFASTVAEEFSSHLGHYQSFSAHFVQTTLSGQGAVVASAQGQFWLNRPDQFRWQTTAPNQQVIVGDGRYVWNYDPDLLQATKQPYNNKAQTPMQLLLSGAKSLSAHFHVSKKTLSADASEFILKANAPASSGFRQITFRFSDNALVAMRLDNTLGQQSSFRFSQIKINQTIPSRRFRFVLPKGVDVINNTGGG